MKSSIFVLAGAIAAGGASAQTFFPSLGDAGLSVRESDFVEARFRTDVNNWDTRLAFDGDPNPSDTTGEVSNNGSIFQNNTFGFDLSYAATSNDFTLTITRPNATTSTISVNAPDIDQLNTIQLFTSGSRGGVSLSNFEFSGAGFFTDMFPSLAVDPNGPTFQETVLYFGDSANLTLADWALTGDVTFGTFTRNNPSEGTKLTVKLLDTVPTPGSAAVLGLAGLGAMRRRR